MNQPLPNVLSSALSLSLDFDAPGIHIEPGSIYIAGMDTIFDDLTEALCPREHLEFHLWYLKAKGWIARIENGMYAITVEGIDRTNNEHRRDITTRLLDHTS